MPVRVSALIVSYNTRPLLVEAVGSVAYEPGVETIVFDNASHDGSPEAIGSHFPEVRVIRSPTNLGFAAGINRAAASACGDAFLLLNSDANMQPGALKRLLALLEQHPRAALVGPALRYADGRPQPAAFALPGFLQVYLDLFPVDRLVNSRWNGRLCPVGATRIGHPLGACMLISRRAWDDVGPLDEGYFMYVEEVDWCRRAQLKGWEIWHEPSAVAVHHGGSSTRQQADDMFAQLWRSRLRYYTRFSPATYNRAMHCLVRLGLRAMLRHADGGRAAALEPVRRLAS